MMLEEKTVFLGERRRVALDVWLVNGAPFDISDPNYSITVAGQHIDCGVPVVTPRGRHWFLQCYIAPTVPYPHFVEMSFSINDERIVRKLKVNVRK